MYKAVINDNYLCHYNQNHSKKNGQFTSGDGDGDGISNDHANQKKGKRKGDAEYDRIKKAGGKKMGVGKGLVIGSLGGAVGTGILGTIAENTGSTAAYVATMISGLSTIALSTVGAAVYSAGQDRVRKAADKEFQKSIKGNKRAQKYLREREKYSSPDQYGYNGKYYYNFK